ncbi:MAG: aldehyde ferredoxin oxidoreductase family protein [Thermodesulfobacteriota bacterium]
MGQILRVNLTNGSLTKEETDKNISKDYIGGIGYADKIFCDEVSPTVDPLSPENKAIVAAGPLVGSKATTAGRIVVVTKSPLNNCIAGSHGGGFFALELKKAGYDMVIIEGKAAKPTYLWINDDKFEIRDAELSWGKVTSEVDKTLKEQTDPKARTMIIGPAGVKLSPIACITVDAVRNSGRSGVGAVFGSKNFLGIAVRGTKEVRFANPDTLAKECTRIAKLVKESPITGEGLSAYGTSAAEPVVNECGAYPIKNAQEAYSSLSDNLGGEAIAKKILTKQYHCTYCITGCGRVTQIREGTYKGHRGMGPEYETGWSLGAMCGVFDLNPVTESNYICNEYGLDTISAGVTIACAMELYEKGYIPEEDVPFPIRFGDGDTVVKLVELTGKREGFGDLLAQGSYRLAEHYGHPELSMSVKKLEIPGYDPRGIKGIGLAYATSNRGACHVRGYTCGAEVYGWPAKVDPLAYEGKAELCKNVQNATAVINSIGMCVFTSFALQFSDYGSLLRAVTGLTYSDDDLLKAGERIWNLERLFNLKAGFTKKDDTLPPRLLNEPIPSGPAKGEVCDLHQMLPEYYKLRGWDEEGKPTKEKLAELDL